MKRKTMRIQAAILSRFTNTIWLAFVCSLFLLNLSFRTKNMSKKLTRSQAATMLRSVRMIWLVLVCKA
jgi:hypothetical protein